MDPNEYIGSDDDAEAQAMAAAIGFTGFGKPAAKKRKFNPSSDAFTEGDDLAKLDKGGKKGQGSGGNTMPLGKVRIIGNVAPTVEAELEREEKKFGNSDEIDLGDDEEEEGPNYVDTSLPPPIESSKPQYLDTVRPPLSNREAVLDGSISQSEVSESEAKEVQSRIDALLASLQPSMTSNPLLSSEASHQLPQRPVNRDTSFNQSRPRRGGSSVGSTSSHAHRQRNETWHIDYYDPSFLANPWAALEEKMGMEPQGNWPEHVPQRNRQ